MAVKKKTPRQPSRSHKLERWQETTDRHEAWAANGPKVRAFEHAARALIAPGKPSDWTEAQRLGMQLARHLEHCFGGGGDAEWEPLLRRACAEFPEPTKERRRYNAVSVIARWGRRWIATPFREIGPSANVGGVVVATGGSNNGERMALLRNCIRELTHQDKAFDLLRADPAASLAPKLSAYRSRPSGVNGAMGAERIVAELVVELDDHPERDDDHDILGIKVDANADPRDEVVRIREDLFTEVDRFRKNLKSQQ